MKLSVEALVHRYDTTEAEARPVLKIDSWSVNSGEMVLLRGVSGSGKTTLFNILSGLLRPTSGFVHYDECEISSMSEAARDAFRAQHIGYVFQNHHLIPSLTVLQNVVAPLAYARRVPRAQWRARALELVEQVGMRDYANRHPRQLSTGQRLRVAVARALANTPSVLLADEPTAALDQAAGAAMIELLQAASRQAGGLLIVASHDPQVAKRFETVYDLHEGELQEGSAAWA